MKSLFAITLCSAALFVLSGCCDCPFKKNSGINTDSPTVHQDDISPVAPPANPGAEADAKKKAN